MRNFAGRPRLTTTALMVIAVALLAAGTAAAQAPDATKVPEPTATATTTPATPAPAAAPAAEGTSAKAPKDAGASRAANRSKVALRLNGLRKGKLTAGNKIKLHGTLRPFAPREKVRVILFRGKKTIKQKVVHTKHKVNAGFSHFRFAEKLVQPGRYSIQVIHHPSKALGASKNRTRTFKMRYPDIDPGNKNSTVQLFNRLLAKQGYVNDEGKKYDAATGRAVLAFHKVNGNKWTENAKSRDFKKLADGRGTFKLKYPGHGKHVEADLSRQVLVLARHGKAQEIYHISSGTPATPTITGHFNFYRKEPGTNSHGMVNSVYFIRGYATHGYPDVPAYPASHGCLRNPIPDSLHIYNWIDIGDPIDVYH